MIVKVGLPLSVVAAQRDEAVRALKLLALGGCHDSWPNIARDALDRIAEIVKADKFCPICGAEWKGRNADGSPWH